VPVVSSNVSSIPEVARDSALLVEPKNPEQIAEAVYKMIDDKALRDKLIELGFDNVKRFNWEKCAKETLEILLQ
jgi:glycosyltransferase involved in cell wall biosynthesis